jgi:hypothetical protein
VTSVSDTLSSTPYRSLVDIGTNYAGAESEEDLANGALNFDMDIAGWRAINLIVTDVQKNFNGKRWNQSGPKAILRVFEILCGTKHVSICSLIEFFVYTWAVHKERVFVK